MQSIEKDTHFIRASNDEIPGQVLAAIMQKYPDCPEVLAESIVGSVAISVSTVMGAQAIANVLDCAAGVYALSQLAQAIVANSAITVRKVADAVGYPRAKVSEVSEFAMTRISEGVRKIESDMRQHVETTSGRTLH